MAAEIEDTLYRYIQNQNSLGMVAELNELLCELIDAKKQNEAEFKALLLTIYRLMQTYENWKIKIGSNVFYKLIAEISAGQHSRQIVANILTCVQVYVDKFPMPDSKLLVDDLWFLSTNCDRQPYSAQILVQLLEDFVKKTDGFLYTDQLKNLIKELLVSDSRQDRRSAYYVMKRLAHEICVSNDDDIAVLITSWGWSSKQSFARGYTTYITILENLDENQSHLILPSLNTIKFIENSSNAWQKWMIILYKKLLNHNNALVLRWSLEYFLDHFTSAQLNLILLKEFLNAANHTHLYNVEGYYLPEEKARNFVKDADIHFIEVLCQINWRSLALHYWLQQMQKTKMQSVRLPKELLFKLASTVRVLQNCRVRVSSNDRMCLLFKPTIDDLTLCEYIPFIETLFNISDPYYDHYRFLAKLQNNQATIEALTKISKRFYQIFTNVYKVKNSTLPIVEHFAELVHEKFIKLLADVASKQHGLLRYLIVFDAKPTKRILKFCQRKYDLDLTKLDRNLSLSNITLIVMDKLFVPMDETRFVCMKCIDFLMTHRIDTWSALLSTKLDPIELLDTGMETTFLRLCELFGAHESRVSDNILPALVQSIKKYLQHNELCKSAVSNIMNYAKRHLTDIELEQLVNNLLEFGREHVGICGGVIESYDLSNKFLIPGLLIGEISTGDPRIESAYEEKILRRVPHLMSLRSNFQMTNQDISMDLFEELLRINNQITLTKSRYFENSMEHRIKIRIVYGTWYMQQNRNLKYWTNALWSALFAQNNQHNVSYLYEVLIARNAPNIEVILEKLREISTFTASQQISLISVIYTHLMLYWTQVAYAQLEEIIEILMPLTMGANFQIRLHAQLVIYRLVSECESRNIELAVGKTLKVAIEQAFGDKLFTYLKEVRLKFHEFYKLSQLCLPDLILYVTNAPFDEFAYWVLRNGFENDFQLELDELKNAFVRKTKRVSLDNNFQPQPIRQIANVQRKMNPTSDILAPNDLAIVMKPEWEMFVVACLIDKLPNLGGIARTCEVLGIANLVIDSKLHVEAKDFQNLSMTAEKTLNILEVKPVDLAVFLIQKQIEGFKIVGAEQTANSVSFVDFKFPAKCVLLLGHEKHGIPAHLLGFLDYAVEIPQSGQVRSLNVHVTGALFMWEYCKQKNFGTS